MDYKNNVDSLFKYIIYLNREFTLYERLFYHILCLHLRDSK